MIDDNIKYVIYLDNYILYNKCTCIGGRLENEPGRPALLCQRRLPGFLISPFSTWWDFPHLTNIYHILDIENDALSWKSAKKKLDLTSGLISSEI